MVYNYGDLFKLISDSKGFCSDSRLVKAGECFFALNGITHKGSSFIKQALQQGAKYAVTDDPSFEALPGVFHVSQVKEALKFCCQKFYTDLPKYKVAVTGTNGKSSIVSYCVQLMQRLGLKAASIGTLGVFIDGQKLEEFSSIASLTSNDLISNYKILTRLKQLGVEFVALEASSIGLDQARLAGIKFQAVAFSSFSQDHLDYHQDLAQYMRAKLLLFEENLTSDGDCYIIEQAAKAILEHGFSLPEKHCYIVGAQSLANIKIIKHQADLEGQSIEFSHLGQLYGFSSQIVGKFQGDNLLLAALLCSSCGFELSQLLSFIDQLSQVKGRLQKISYLDRAIFIDYAHNPDALETILRQLRELKPEAKIITIFGCGGNRDNKKRPIMGAIASNISDFVILTDDNPRKEQPENIIQEIVAGITKNNYQIIHNRAEAIQAGLNMLNDYDILLIAGKGHEEYQLYGDRIIKFSDEDTIKQKILTL